MSIKDREGHGINRASIASRGKNVANVVGAISSESFLVLYLLMPISCSPSLCRNVQTIAIWMIVLVTVDRFTCVCRPLVAPRYFNRITRPRFVVLVFIAGFLYNLPRYDQRAFLASEDIPFPLSLPLPFPLPSSPFPLSPFSFPLPLFSVRSRSPIAARGRSPAAKRLLVHFQPIWRHYLASIFMQFVLCKSTFPSCK